MALATLPQPEQIACSLYHHARVAASPFPILAISKQGMNLAVRFVADSVNLRSKLLPRSFRILIEQRLNLIVVPQAEAGPAAAVSESTPDLS
jgi:hypothetical protein